MKRGRSGPPALRRAGEAGPGQPGPRRVGSADRAVPPRAPSEPQPGSGTGRADRERSRDSAPEGLVLLGEFGRAHGLKGEVRLKSFTSEPTAIASYGPLIAEHGRSLTLTGVRPAPGGAPDLLIARVEGISTREAAEALNRSRLYLERSKLPPPEEDEFLLADLIGLSVQDGAGATLGTIVAVPNFGGGDLIEIAPAQGGATALLPFTKAFVPEVDIAGGRVVVNAPDDLFEPAREPPESAA